MAIGFPSKITHSMPPGRRGFAAEDGVESRTVIPPGKYADGQDRMGTPAGTMHTTAATGRYLDAAAKKHRAAERGVGDTGTTGARFGSDNPTVESKNDKRYGRNGSRLEGATFKSTGNQPADKQHDDLPPSFPQRSMPRATEHHEVVSFLNGEYHEATHPNTGRHYGGHANAANTDSAPGQAHSVSGGKYGGKQIRPAAVTNRPGVHPVPGVGAHDRADYLDPRKNAPHRS
jgi:hypothetical protein